ncbi:hypothetical protein LEP1GSC017_0701 [Leptospira meyeri serovar Hardjo str. Went 5]|nr:hypothetical protein LEP1GSC017_0701 [Leptospira meyeri serovar Hardjo str. Went 5]EMJ90117.1 hypothetical protein LEP1GSC196_2720 [Leptospira meyeri serovar Semaranga str. Veldrot Semarang 173]
MCLLGAKAKKRPLGQLREEEIGWVTDFLWRGDGSFPSIKKVSEFPFAASHKR